MKKSVNLLLAALVSVATSATFGQSNDVILDEIIAVVNDGVILHSEIKAQTRFLVNQAKAARQPLPDNDVLNERIREKLINEEIQRQRAAELGIEIDEASINQAIEQIASNNNMNTFEFREALRAEGLDYNHYRTGIRHELLLDRLIQREVRQGINVSEQEIDDFIKSTSTPNAENQQYLLRHILIAEPSSSSSANIDKARERAEALVNRLRGGESFSKIAAAVSDGPRALNGGDLGWRKIRELPRFLHATVTAAIEGNISDPVQSADGFHIVKLEGKRLGDQKTQIETRARHIFISTNGDNATENDKAQARLLDVLAQLKTGADFASLASEISDDPNSAGKGGELPWFTPGQMPKELDQLAKSLKPGQISQPFQTQFGWHLMEVLERRDASTSDDSKRREAEAGLRARKLEQETDRWSRRLRSEAFVEILK